MHWESVRCNVPVSIGRGGPPFFLFRGGPPFSLFSGDCVRVSELELTSNAQSVFDFLEAQIPTLPKDLRHNLDVPLRARLTHTQLQSLFLACQVLNVELTRDALVENSTGRDIVEWLYHCIPSPADSPDLQNTRPARGSYRTTNVTIRPIGDRDFSPLYTASLDPRTNHRWRFRGQTPSPDEFRAALFHPNTLAQFMVMPLASDGLGIGLVSAYSADLSAGYCYAAVQRVPSESALKTDGLLVEGFFVFVQYLFDHFKIDKIYLEIPEYNRSLIAGGTESMLVEEGRLINYHYYGDRAWDQYIYSLRRSTWDEVASSFRGEWPDGRVVESTVDGAG